MSYPKVFKLNEKYSMDRGTPIKFWQIKNTITRTFSNKKYWDYEEAIRDMKELEENYDPDVDITLSMKEDLINAIYEIGNNPKDVLYPRSEAVEKYNKFIEKLAYVAYWEIDINNREAGGI